MKRRIRISAAAVLAALLGAATVFAQAPPAKPMIYPAKGQTAAQQEKDTMECGAWATKQTGYDPVQAAHDAQAAAQKSQADQAAAAQNAQAQANQVGGERAGGAVKGAAAGAVVGAVTGDAGQGAAVGAAAGVVAGGARQRGKKRAIAEQQQAATQQAQQTQAAAQKASADKLAEYTRASNACMEGRGYTIK
jgi:OmpA family protein